MNVRLTSVIVLSLFMTLTMACSSGRQGSTRSVEPAVAPGQGSITLTVTPNPIVAKKVSGDTYDFPFTILIREFGGSSVDIEVVRIDVVAFGGLNVYSQSFGPEEITRRGFSTVIAPRGELKYDFNPRKEVADDRLFSAVTAKLRVEGLDQAGNRVSADTSVTVDR